MLNIKEVEDAKALMSEAVDWSVMRWLKEKKRVRKAADLANEVLDSLDRQVKSRWSSALKAAYDELDAATKANHGPRGNGVDEHSIKALARSIKQADQEAYRAHMDAEETFDMAEKRLSTSMAREGTRKAIASWDLREKAIIQSKAANAENKAAS